jgi:B12-binding domain/radical SAM domain protein
VKNGFVFVDYSYNRYSLAVLTGTLEADERFCKLPIHFLKSQTKQSETDPGNEALVRAISQLAKVYERLAIGFSFHTPNVLSMAFTIKELKEYLAREKINNVLLIAGGPHPSGDPLGTLELGIDVVVVGEGEVVLPNLLEAYYRGESFAGIRGLSFFEDGRYRFTGKAAPIDLSDYPAFAPNHRRYAPIEIGRGCPWACKFCQTPFLMGGRMRYRSVESIERYARIAKEQLKIRDLRFITPVSFAYGSEDGRSTNPEAVEDLLKTVAKIFGKEHVFFGSFPSEVRPESVTPEMLELVKRYCANDNLIIGAQSGSNRMLGAIHRGHSVAEVLRACKLILDYGFACNVDFIFGMPGETPEDIEASLELMMQLSQLGARVHSHTFMPLVGTPLSDTAPGTVDEKTRRLLEQLRGKGLEYGHWQVQEVMAETSSAFVRSQQKRRPENLQSVHSLRSQ